ncbi:MAG: matrixin family metalloprotease [Nitrososphaerota archaeon]|nr:matrixin family metalloprotease [Nitrososphaerales archaeon]MDW8044882.1 matrixin family metalloprotease [Nitrososphaerota archaeon]
MSRKTFAFASILLLSTLLISSMIVPTFSAYATWQDQTKAEKFIEIAQHAYEIAIEFRERARSRGIDVTKADKMISEGEALLKEAKYYLEKGEYSKSFERANRAQERFREAIKSLNITPKEGREVEEERGRGILVAIERIEERIKRIKDVIAYIKETSENQRYIEWVKGNLTEAENNLKDARAALEKRNVTRAAHLLGEANRNIEEAFRALRLISDWTIGWRIKNFFKGIEKLLDDVEKSIERLAKSGVKVDDLMKRLEEARKLIESAKDKLLVGDKKGALDDVKKAHDILKDILKDIAKRIKIPPRDVEKPRKEVPLKQSLADAPNRGAAAWDDTTISVLIKPNVYLPNSPEVSAGRRAIDRWKVSLTWFSKQDWNNDTLPDYPWLDKINFIVYVQGVNETLMKAPPDVTITYHYKIAPGYILGSTKLSFKRVGTDYAIQSVDIIIGVKGLTLTGIENLVAHEFGHALGLEHSNVKGDLMYPSFNMEEEKRSVVSPSTLNLYSLTINYGWLETGKFSQYRGTLSITLPEHIPYQRAP